MPSLSVFGAQWGDEGKGKIIDLLARDADVVVRYQGGSNAGHTVIVGEDKYVLHLIPSGILHPGKVNVVGNGVALDPLTFMDEVDGLRERGIPVEPENLRLSTSAHVILDHHRKLDGLAETWLGGGRIGTTGRGIGPCYADKASRTGLRVSELLEPGRCRERLSAALLEKNALFAGVHEAEGLELEEQVEKYVAVGERLRPFVCDTGAYLRGAHAEGKSLLFEGAQGVMLDIDHGTYPYVTSSSTGANGIPSGAGFPAKHVDRLIGIAKAYCTRVGEGPFPSEEHGEAGERLGRKGHEFGATTGRPRRCGWFDSVAVRYALDLNGADGWIMTKLDVLDSFEKICVGTSYKVEGEESLTYPVGCADLNAVEVQYEELPGWQEDITAIRKYEELPAATRAYVEWVEERVGAPIVMLSVGPERDQVIPRGL
ncbi:MAG: adenylosuccinate synthase [Planctomycetes bacterium]|nr:adenylosuccinate synthase [Planctomycetota bacterium]